MRGACEKPHRARGSKGRLIERIVMSSKIVCHLVKPKRRNSQGRLVCAKYWRVRYKLRGQRRWQEKSLGVVDKQTAEAELSKFRVEHEHEAAGIVAPKPLREAA